jgi:hypothetical protein
MPELFGPTTRTVFGEFVARPAEERALRAWGFSEGEGPLGFDYLPLLVEFGGPSQIEKLKP